MRIIGPPSADRQLVFGRLSDPSMVRHFRFLAEMFHPLWVAAVAHGIDPVGVVAQAYKETGGGTFGGRVTSQHYNTCGLKVRHLGYGGTVTAGDEQLAHAAFASWDVGATAHVQHLCAYTGQPVPGLVVDPRYTLVSPLLRLEDFEDLGGRWAPSPTYGTELVAIARRLQGATP